MTLNPLTIIGDAITAVGGYFRDGQKIKAAVNERKDELSKLNLEAKIKTATASIDNDKAW